MNEWRRGKETANTNSNTRKKHSQLRHQSLRGRSRIFFFLVWFGLVWFFVCCCFGHLMLVNFYFLTFWTTLASCFIFAYERARVWQFIQRWFYVLFTAAYFFSFFLGLITIIYTNLGSTFVLYCVLCRTVPCVLTRFLSLSLSLPSSLPSYSEVFNIFVWGQLLKVYMYYVCECVCVCECASVHNTNFIFICLFVLLVWCHTALPNNF